jgi:hypothetical protein
MRNAINRCKSGRLRAIFPSQDRLSPFSTKIINHVIGYQARQEGMTLRRAVLDQIFDSWFHEVTHVFVWRHFMTFQGLSISIALSAVNDLT